MLSLRIFRQFILRSLAHNGARCVAAVAAIAIGVAVMLAVRLANSSVTETFRAAIDAVGGEASLRVRGVAGRFDERLFGELDGLLPGATFSPAISTMAMVVGASAEPSQTNPFPSGELLQVLGVDILDDFDLRDYDVLRTAAGDTRSARETLGLLNDPRSIILTEKFLRRHGLRVGDPIRLTFDSEQFEYRIRGVLLNRGPALTLDGNFALMDIAAAQLAADRLGRLDYVDVRLPEGADPQAALERLRERLPEALVVEEPDASFGRTNTMIAAFQFNLEALSGVALVVGLLLIYNTVAISVAARRDEIGVLRATGASQRTVMGLFLGEAFLLATLGTTIGLPLGRALASYAVAGAAQTVETFYIAGVAESSASQLRLTLGDVLFAAGVVGPLSLLAAAIPARDAARVSPVEAVRGNGQQFTKPRLRQKHVGLVACLLLGWALTLVGPIGGRPVAGFGAALLILLSGVFLSPVLLSLLCRFASRLGAVGGMPARVEMRLAGANVVSALPRVSISVAALAAALSMMVAIAIMVGSFRETVTVWLDSAFSADLAVKPVMQSSSVSEARLSDHAINVIQTDPDVADTVGALSRQIPDGDRVLRIASTRLDRTLRESRRLFKQPPLAAIEAGGFEPGQALVSEPLALQRGLGRGDTLSLPTDNGRQQVTIAGVYYDYSSNQGTVLLDEATYAAFFPQSDPSPRPQSLSILLKPGADPAAVRRRINDRLGDDEQVYCVTSQEIRTEAMRIFDSTFTITYALQLIAVIVAGVGVASTLATLILDRKRELGLLCLVGATRQQIRRVVLCEAVLVGLASQVTGVVLGVLLSAVLILVINVQAFGWTIQFRLPWAFLAGSSLLVVAAAAAFGWFPAVRAAAMNPLATTREN
ncbi:ABC transporter permease YtrF precursor [Posidoniimonas polymericola]|uniref:ABC transporter permease YtrF n=1 Tax=Posidoniimonas polymericola TaxID=2528002 RepID=A0A5C5YUN8_9BACT|nr:FtsX-like permease family protein [Posidoniimonas polymericola]TWT78373.1 ABC transporter permease YtrF precursor [Posidoniimonas polymericola]